MLLKTLRISLFLCILVSAKAQTFVDAVIFKPNGDSISGKINYQEWYINPEFISFKATNASKIQVFRPKDISKFVVKSKNEIYESADFVVLVQTQRDLEATDASENLKDALQSLKFQRDTAFLLVLEKGKAALYSYVDKSTYEHYFIRKENGVYIELMNPKFKIKEADKKYMEHNRISYLNVEDYKTRLLELTSDCPTLKQEINKLGYSPGYFRSLISRYNDCIGKNDYSKEIPKPKLKYYATLGLSLPFAKVNGLFYRSTDLLLGKSTPPIGGGFEVMMGRGLSPLGFGAEIYMASNRFKGEVSGNGRSVSYDAKLTGIHLYPYMKTSLVIGKQKNQAVFFKLGAILTYYPTRFCKKVYTVPANFFGDESFTLTKTAFSFVISGGYEFKKLYIEGLFLPYAQNVILNSEDSFRAIGATLKVGYFF